MAYFTVMCKYFAGGKEENLVRRDGHRGEIPKQE
jgi:hypothetical protein